MGIWSGESLRKPPPSWEADDASHVPRDTDTIKKGTD